MVLTYVLRRIMRVVLRAGAFLLYVRKERTEMRKFAIVGIGLIGGSMAIALKGFKDFKIVGADISAESVEYANAHGVGDEATTDISAAIKDADVVMLGMDPQGIVDFLHEHKDDFKPGCLVTDVCGVKEAIMNAAECLPEGVDFIGCHPMAGTEFSGVQNAFGEMFKASHLLITPREGNTEEHLTLMEELGEYIGCRDVVRTDPREHDRLLAYTSQMMHIIALSICDDDELFICKGYEGTSFRGATRVAALDVPLWTQLFSLNLPALTEFLDNLIENLTSYREELGKGDPVTLASKIAKSADRKRAVDLPGPDLLH